MSDTLFENFVQPSGDNFIARDISDEEYRTYEFDDYSLTINNPVVLYLPTSGEKNKHRVVDAEGVSHYITDKWIHLEWKSRSKEYFKFF